MVPHEAQVTLDAILLHAEQNQLSLIEATRADGKSASLLCCQIVEDGKLTIVPVAELIDIGSIKDAYTFPPEYAAMVVQMANHSIEVGIPGVDKP